MRRTVPDRRAPDPVSAILGRTLVRRVDQLALDGALAGRVPAPGVEVARGPVLVLDRDPDPAQTPVRAVALQPVEQPISDLTAAVGRRHQDAVDHELARLDPR